MTTVPHTTERAEVRVTGVVQGVGFRPFVYRTALEHDLAGRVKNTGDGGVDIVLEGTRSDIEAFLADLEERPPPLATIETISVLRSPSTGLASFEIVSSTDASGGSGTIPPDTGICPECRRDMRDPTSRFHEYWATACVDCGPRYTIIRTLPYDRPRTSMETFPLCEDCRDEYEDPGDRRYHAQTIACPACGPALRMVDPDGTELATGTESVRRTAERLSSGGIVAVKGIGGAHMVCDATDGDAVDRLRERTGRPEKPFALMAPSMESVESFAEPTEPERDSLTDIRRPILLLDRSAKADWLDAVAPSLHTVGVMLPYSGLHHLLFDHVETPLVMTSANRPGRPMCTSTRSILDHLGDVVDFVLTHDREIATRCDDSVQRFSAGKPRFLRRSRGWVPAPLQNPVEVPAAEERPTILALGAEYDTTVALTQGPDVVLSQHLGDVDDPATLSFLRETVEHLSDLTGDDPDHVACDLHPEFLTTDQAETYADETMGGPIRVQHHHAHAASLLAEHGERRAIVIAADGTGYGPDGSIWGGEVLDATLSTARRVGGLGTFHLPGGTAAIDHPARILAGALTDTDRIDELLLETGTANSPAECAVIRQQYDQGINVLETTSAGRFLDAVSSMTGACHERHYEGEPAMKLESLATRGSPIDIRLPFTKRDGARVVDVTGVLRELDSLLDEHAPADVAATAQEILATGLASIAIAQAEARGIRTVGFTGGVAYNDAIGRSIETAVRDAGLTYLDHTRVPPGDGGIAYGQAVIAAESVASGR